MDQAADLQAASGRPVPDITLDAATAGLLTGEDLQIDPATLRAQAHIAREAGFVQLAANLERAAELTAVPNDKLLQMYEALRPRRSNYADLMALADTLEEDYQAPTTAAFVREAAEVYQARGLLRRT
jgi:propanediol dehydratase small subunit